MPPKPPVQRVPSSGVQEVRHGRLRLHGRPERFTLRPSPPASGPGHAALGSRVSRQVGCCPGSAVLPPGDPGWRWDGPLWACSLREVGHSGPRGWGRAWHADGGRPRREAPGGVTGRPPWSPPPPVQAGRPAPHLGTRKSRTHRTSHHPRARLCTRAAGPTAPPEPGDGGSEEPSPARLEPRPRAWEGGRESPACHCPGSRSRGLSPQEALGRSEGTLRSRQGEGTATHSRAFNRRCPRPCGPRRLWVCGRWRPLHRTRLAGPL